MANRTLVSDVKTDCTHHRFEWIPEGYSIWKAVCTCTLECDNTTSQCCDCAQYESAFAQNGGK